MPRLVLYVIACICLTAATERWAGAAVPLEVYGRLPTLEDVALSPDGSRVAYVRTTEDARLITIVSLADRKMLGGLRVKNQKLRSIEWADDNHLMIVTSTTSLPWGLRGEQAEWGLLQVYDLVSHKSVEVPSRESLRGVRMMNVIAGRVMVRHVDGHTVLFVPGIYVERQTLPALVRFDLDTGIERLVVQGSAASYGWLVDADGELVAEQAYNEQSQDWRLRIRRDGRLQDALSGRAALNIPGILGFGPTADTLLIQAMQGEHPVWKLLSLKDGTLGPPMAESKTLNSPIEDHASYRMIGGVHIEDDTRYVFFDPIMQAQWDVIVRTFDAEHVRLVSAADGFTKFVVRVDGAKHGFLYELVDLKAHRADPIGDVYEGGALPLPVRRITYAATDGLQIPAYLTLPRVDNGKNPPLIVLTHGGPAARDTADFDWWAQALADQNYAVLQPNYRGSDLD